jgi:hypothetical protein
MKPALHTARQNLIDRGLVSPDFRLTDAGNAEVDRLIREWRELEVTCSPEGPRVRWRYAPRKAA